MEGDAYPPGALRLWPYRAFQEVLGTGIIALESWVLTAFFMPATLEGTGVETRAEAILPLPGLFGGGTTEARK